jgi:uncharacterized protein YkwD
VRRGVCILLGAASFALLAASAEAVVTGSEASPLPKLERAHVSPNAFRNARGTALRRGLRRLVRARTVARPSRARASRRAISRLSALETGLLARVNALRARHGLRALRLSRGLTAAAAYHSQQMVRHGFFEHESRGGGAFWKRVERFYGSRGYRMWEVGENLAYGSPDLGAAATVRMWLNSPGHRENLLARRWREIGLGAVHAGSAGGEFGGSAVTVITADFGYRVR